MPVALPIVLQQIDLDIIPGKIPPIVHVSEYDTGRNIVVNLFRDGYPFGSNSIESYTVKVEGSIGKYGFSENAAWADDAEGVVVIHLTEAMTAIHGRVWTKIKLIKSESIQISTCGFWLDVDRAGVNAQDVIEAKGFEQQIVDAVNDYLDEHGTGSGDADALKQMLYLMLIPILKEGLYGTDQTNAISALETALGTVPVVTQTVTNNLTNVTTSNDATVVVKGTAYTTTLTPVGDAVIQTVTVMMKGVDVTASVYSNGTISIPSITGDIVITAVAESMIETYTPSLSEGYVNPSNGSVGGTSTYKHTEIIPVREGDKVYGHSYDSSASTTANGLAARFTATYDSNDAIYASGGSSTETAYKDTSPFVVPSGVYGVVFSIVNRYANDVVVYVDKSERVGA